MQSESQAITDWVPAVIGWKAFCDANPALGLAGSPSSWSWARRHFGDDFMAAGVLRRSAGRTLLIHTPSFAAAAFDILTAPAANVAAI